MTRAECSRSGGAASGSHVQPATLPRTPAPLASKFPLKLPLLFGWLTGSLPQAL
jgi:hypothetical protein